jgi:vitamin B12 transporter
MLEVAKTVAAILLFLALDRASAGESEPDPEQTLIIRGERISAFQPAGGFTEIISIDEATSFSSAAEEISRAAGIQVRRLGGLGSFGAASIRGSTPEQVPVYLDGVLLNAGGFEVVDLSRLPAGMIEEIVLVRGPAASYFGGPGGAIFIKSRRSGGEESRLTLGAGSFGAWSAAGNISLPLSPGRIFAGASLEGARGDFLYLNRNGTLFEPADDVIQRRANNRHLSASAQAALEAELGRWKGSFGLEGYYRAQGLAGIENLPTEKARFECGRESARLELSRSWPELFLQTQFAQLYLFEELEDTQGAHGELGLGRQHTRARTHSLDGAAQLTAESRLGLVGGRFEARYEQMTTEDLLNAEQPGAKRRLQFSAGAEDRWRPAKDLELTPSARLQYYYSWFEGGPLPGRVENFPTTFRGDFSWQAALAASYRVWPRITIKANLARSLRHPSLGELFGGRGAAVGNPDLKPEEAWLADAGAVWEARGGSLDWLRLEAAFFSSWAEDLIVWVQNSQSSVRPENVQRSRTLGAEVSLRLKVISAIGLEANYTLLDGRDLSPAPYLYGKHLPGRPVHQAYGKIIFEPHGEKWRLRLWTDADYAGSNFLDQANLKEDTLARLIFGAGLKLERPQEGFSVEVEVRNLLDSYILTDARGMKHPLRDFESFPLPGRTVFVIWNQKL